MSRRPCACCSTRRRFKEPENAGIYLGFVAGAIGSNPAKGRSSSITSFFPVPPEDEWVIVRAVAYSGVPDWRNVLRRLAPRMPARKVMIDSYLAGKLPTLTEIPLEEAKPGMMDKLRGAFTRNPFAKEEQEAEHDGDLRQQSGSAGYAVGILFRDRLPCSRSSASCRCCHGARAATPLDKLTVGSMARYTPGELRDPRCQLARISCAASWRGSRRPVKAPLARSGRGRRHRADRVRCARMRFAAVDELKVKGSDSRRNLGFWGAGRRRRGRARLRIGGGAGAGRRRHPCVIGGSASQGLLSFWEKQQ